MLRKLFLVFTENTHDPVKDIIRNNGKQRQTDQDQKNKCRCRKRKDPHDLFAEENQENMVQIDGVFMADQERHSLGLSKAGKKPLPMITFGVLFITLLVLEWFAVSISAIVWILAGGAIGIYAYALRSAKEQEGKK